MKTNTTEKMNIKTMKSKNTQNPHEYQIEQSVFDAATENGMSEKEIFELLSVWSPAGTKRVNKQKHLFMSLSNRSRKTRPSHPCGWAFRRLNPTPHTEETGYFRFKNENDKNQIFCFNYYCSNDCIHYYIYATCESSDIGASGSNYWTATIALCGRTSSNRCQSKHDSSNNFLHELFA